MCLLYKVFLIIGLSIFFFVLLTNYSITFNKNKQENMTDISSINNEAIQNIASVYNNNNLAVTNLQVTGSAKLANPVLNDIPVTNKYTGSGPVIANDSSDYNALVISGKPNKDNIKQIIAMEDLTVGNNLNTLKLNTQGVSIGRDSNTTKNDFITINAGDTASYTIWGGSSDTGGLQKGSLSIHKYDNKAWKSRPIMIDQNGNIILSGNVIINGSITVSDGANSSSVVIDPSQDHLLRVHNTAGKQNSDPHFFVNKALWFGRNESGNDYYFMTNSSGELQRSVGKNCQLCI